MLADIQQRSVEHYNRLLSSDTGIALVQKFSVVDADVVSALKTLHPFCLWLAQPFFGQEEYLEGMDRLYAVDKDGNPTKFNSIVGRVIDMSKRKQNVFPKDFVSTQVAPYLYFSC